MKTIIILLLAFLAVPMALATDGELINLKGTCDSSGNAEISMLHSGGAIKASDIQVTSTNIETEYSQKISGKWSQEGSDNNIYLTGDYSRVNFTTQDGPFKEKGAFEIHFVFYSKPEDYSATDVSLLLDCPGSACVSDYECDGNSACKGNVCTALRCKASEFVEFHTCNPKCNDRNPCTIDRYNFEDGSCAYEKNESCCRVDADCNDGLACLEDRCENGKCIHNPVKCEAAKDRCVNAACIEPRGCVYETDESCLANENEKREYLIVIGEPKVYRAPFFSRLFGAIGNFLRNLF